MRTTEPAAPDAAPPRSSLSLFPVDPSPIPQTAEPAWIVANPWRLSC
jgi:hypothetical protein